MFRIVSSFLQVSRGKSPKMGNKQLSRDFKELTMKYFNNNKSVWETAEISCIMSQKKI